MVASVQVVPPINRFIVRFGQWSPADLGALAARAAVRQVGQWLGAPLIGAAELAFQRLLADPLDVAGPA